MGNEEARRGNENRYSGDESSHLATDGISKTCFGRRFILDPATRTIVDVGGDKVNDVISLGGAGVRGILAAPDTAINMGKRVVMGVRSQTEVGATPPLSQR